MGRYSDQERNHALALYVDHGPTEASRQTGIPKGTIAGWAKAVGARTVRNAKTEAATLAAQIDAARLREQLRLKMLVKAHDALARMDEPHKDFRGKDEVWWDKAPSGAMKDYATTMAILLDKYRLEVGEATTRSEVHERSDLDREIAELLAEG